MECLGCNIELKCIDYYGKIKHANNYYTYPQSWIEKEGDIFKCENEECEFYDEYFYSDKQNNLKQGYPC
jgi:hypothetical protein